jgi:hypothetical protein
VKRFCTCLQVNILLMYILFFTHRELKAQSDENALTINRGRDDRSLNRYDDRDRPHSRSRSRSRSRSVSRSASNSPFEDTQSVALQAEQKLRLRSMIRGKIVGIYRKCLFAMRDPRLSSLSDTGTGSRTVSRSGSGRFDGSGKVSESWGFIEEEESLSLRSEIDGDGDDYDHDRDFDLLGRTFRDMGRQKSRYTAPRREKERERERDTNTRNRSSVSMSQDGAGLYPGPRLCQWLDKELAALRGMYEGEIRTLEDIITNLRELLRETDRMKKVKRKTKGPSSKTIPDRMRQSDVFLVRHVDDEKVGLRSSTKTFFNSTY